jgi:hypothetical protein
MRLLIFGLLVLLTTNLTAQENQFNIDKKYHPDSLRHWTKSIMDGLSLKHPGFYRYTSKEIFDHLTDSTAQTISDSLNQLEYYKKLKPLFAKIGCLHTSVTLSSDYYPYFDKTPTLLPFEVFIGENSHVFIAKNHSSNNEIQAKSELLSINRKPINEIIRTLFNSIPSDGKNETLKVLVLNHHFALWYQTIIEASEYFDVEILADGKVIETRVKGVTKEVFPTMESLESADKKQLDFVVNDGIGILTVHTFAKSVIKKNGQNFKRYVKATFKELKSKRINDLVIDLRYNTGGTDGNAAFLASYFFDASFRYWEKIEVTEAIAKEIKGIYKLFYKKPVQKDNSFYWRKTWVTKEFDYYETQKHAKNSFTGKTYLLTNGLCMSSCSDFIAILQHNKKAKVVGQETGGGFQGNNSGMMPTAKIPTDLIVTVPLQKYTNAVDLTKNFGRGTIPDYQLTPTFDDWVNKKDIEMEFVLQLIKRD